MPSFHLMALFFAAYIHTNLPVKLFKKSSFSDRSSAKINIPLPNNPAESTGWFLSASWVKDAYQE